MSKLYQLRQTLSENYHGGIKMLDEMIQHETIKLEYARQRRAEQNEYFMKKFVKSSGKSESEIISTFLIEDKNRWDRKGWAKSIGESCYRDGSGYFTTQKITGVVRSRASNKNK